MGRVCLLESRGQDQILTVKLKNLKRNGIAEYTQDIELQRPIVRGSKDHYHPFLDSGEITTVGSGEIQDHWIIG
jgi:hypothetical protein